MDTFNTLRKCTIFFFISADKPDCVITRREVNDEDTLICIGTGNPDKVKLKYPMGQFEKYVFRVSEPIWLYKSIFW